MPVRRIGPNKPGKHPNLVNRLMQELGKNEEGESAPEDPFIIEEIVNQGPAMHVLVIWDSWKDVAMEDRGAVIMDAYEGKRGKDEARNISLAMALTYQEARDLKIGPPDIVGEAS